MIGGTLWKKPEARKSNAGKTYVIANVRATDGDGQHLFVSVIAFSDSATAALLALNDGDSVALAGTLKIGVYEPREGSARPNVSIVAQHVLTSYHVTRKRKAMADAAVSGDKRTKQSAMADDDLEF
nr:single-stranded DNA-binding protein [Paraburkholderia caribensis]